MGDSILKHLDHDAVEVEVESEWDKAIKIIITQEEKS